MPRRRNYRDRANASRYEEYVAKTVDPGRLAELVADLLRRRLPQTRAAD
jgi:hypothetical protein